MSRDGVNLEHSLESDLPTAKAILALDERGSAHYRFETEATATFDFRADWLPVASDALPYIFYVGSLATIVEPGASSLLSWLAQSKREKKIRVIFDPNIRPNFLNDSDSYRQEIEKWIPYVDLIKASEEDIRFLYPQEEQESIVSRWFAHGVSLVVITRGERGMVAISADETCGVEGVKGDLVDTVGAGDTVGAVMVDAMMKFGLEEMQGENLAKTLEVAARAAAITCSRQGANPPTKEEYENLWR
jgi:fructokinase